MNVYGLPECLPAPDLMAMEGGSFSDRMDAWEAAEQAHKAALIAWLKLEGGATGPNTGKEYRTPVADGHACYMFADVPNGESFLVHLPYGDGWQARDIEFIPEPVILERITQQERIDAMFAERAKWQTLAQANGWTVVMQDPETGNRGPVLYHEELDRVWPAGDWEGAARDIGLDETDFPADAG